MIQHVIGGVIRGRRLAVRIRLLKRLGRVYGVPDVRPQPLLDVEAVNPLRKRLVDVVAVALLQRSFPLSLFLVVGHVDVSVVIVVVKHVFRVFVATLNLLRPADSFLQLRGIPETLYYFLRR